MEPTDFSDLQAAKALLENPGLAAKITHLIGLPIEKGFDLLPANWNAKVADITRGAIARALRMAVLTLKDRPQAETSDLWHKAAAAASGGLGGFFGLAALAVELPISTAIMLRSIADIARSQGERIHVAESQLACIEVLALGGPRRGDNAADSGYLAVRAALARSVTEAAEYISKRGLVEKGAPPLVRLIVAVAQRFGVQVSEKAAAQAIPAIGAAGGLLVNTLFIDHFQDMARGHFTVRRLERKYGLEVVQNAYRSL